jgi:putative ubiquitin-RnfH superfamily antitoxin RatB of RatAB toxin-antitoxin module
LNEAAGVIKVSVVWGVAGRADALVLGIKEGTTIEEFVASASVRENVPASIPADAAGYGVWGKLRPLTYALRDGDRVELYRSLRVDPKEQRRKRAS